MGSKWIGGLSLIALVSGCLVYVGCVGDDPATAITPEAEDAGADDPGDDPGPNPGPNDPGDPNEPKPPTGCPAGCLPPAPSGWAGPSAVYDGPPETKPDACPSSGYTELEIEAHQGLSGGAAVCSCGTPTLEGAHCSANVVGWNNASCSGNPITDAVLEGTATTNGACVEQVSNQSHLKVDPPTLKRGTCTFPDAEATVPPPTVAKVDLACGVPQHAACEARAECLAAPALETPFTRVCIYKDGDVACPSEDYSERFVAHRTIADTRACADCEGTPTGGTCGTKWGFGGSAPAICHALPSGPTTYDTGACVPGGKGKRLDVRAMAPTGVSCTDIMGGTPTGTLESADPVTFCCTK